MSYARYRYMITVPLAAGRTLNQVLHTIPLAGNRIITIFNFYVYITTAGAASSKIELLFDGAAVSPALTITNGTSTGLVGRDNPTTRTMPLTVTTAAAGSRLTVNQAVADASGVGTLVLDIDYQR